MSAQSHLFGAAAQHNTEHSLGHRIHIRRDSVQSTSSRGSLYTSSSSADSRRDSVGSFTRKMHTTVAIADETPHRFKILPLRATRGIIPPFSGDAEPEHPAATGRINWAARLRHKRTKSAGSSLSSSRREEGVLSEMPTVPPRPDSFGQITVSTETIQHVDETPRRFQTLGRSAQRPEGLEANPGIRHNDTTSRHASIPAGSSRKRARSSTVSHAGTHSRRATDGNVLSTTRTSVAEHGELGTRRHAIYAYSARELAALSETGDEDFPSRPAVPASNIVTPSYFGNCASPKRERKSSLVPAPDGHAGVVSGSENISRKCALRPRIVLADLDVNALPQRTSPENATASSRYSASVSVSQQNGMAPPVQSPAPASVSRENTLILPVNSALASVSQELTVPLPPTPASISQADTFTSSGRPDVALFPIRLAIIKPLNIRLKKRDTIDEVVHAGLLASSDEGKWEQINCAIVAELMRELDAAIESWASQS